MGQKRTASISWTEQLKSQSLDIGTEEDSIHQLDRAAQVTIFRLKPGHCQLLSHLHRLKISHSDACPCGTGPQTPNHILQSCLTLDIFETPDMAQSGGCPQEALGTGWDTAADCGLRLTHRTEDLTWLGTQKKKNPRRCITQDNEPSTLPTELFRPLTSQPKSLPWYDWRLTTRSKSLPWYDWRLTSQPKSLPWYDWRLTSQSKSLPWYDWRLTSQSKSLPWYDWRLTTRSKSLPWYDWRLTTRPKSLPWYDWRLTTRSKSLPWYDWRLTSQPKSLPWYDWRLTTRSKSLLWYEVR